MVTNNMHRNIYIIILIALTVAMAALIVLLYQVYPVLTQKDVPALAPWIILLMMGMLVVCTVLYARRSDRIRIYIYNNNIETLSNNVFWTNLWVVWMVVIIGGVFCGDTIPRIFSHNVPRFIDLLSSSVYLVIIPLLFATVILYAREEERVTRAIFINFAKGLGADGTALQQFRQPVYGNRKIPGIWVAVQVAYKSHLFAFSAENVLGSSKLGCFRYFLISMSDMIDLPHKRDNLLEILNPQAKSIFEEIQKELKRSWKYKEYKLQLLTKDGKISCRVPLTSKTSLKHLQSTMDILLSIRTMGTTTA